MHSDPIEPEEIIQLGICDYASQLRGKGFPLADLSTRERTGVGLAPTNLMINAFGEIPATPWGPRGELVMMPDPSTQWSIPGDGDRPAEHVILADLLTLDGHPWSGCPRHLLRSALTRLRDDFGLQMKAAFEHEFHYSGAAHRVGDAYMVESVGSAGGFPGTALAIMRRNGIAPESFLAEFGPQQFEVTHASALGMEAADRAVQVRHIIRRAAAHFGEVASFAPLMAAGAVGNGVHVHFSLCDLDGAPVSFDPGDADGVSPTAGAFLAGILRDMPAILALSAASAVSYDRLQPNRWSATYNNLGRWDREAAVRICPVLPPGSTEPEAVFNFEYRAADVSGNPYLTLGALVWAGLCGLQDGLGKPAVTTSDPQAMSSQVREELGLARLPRSLAEALDALRTNARLAGWLGEETLAAFLTTKHGELDLLADLSESDKVARYVAAY